MIITSKYDSPCKRCNARIAPGDQCEWTKGLKGVLCLKCLQASGSPASSPPIAYQPNGPDAPPGRPVPPASTPDWSKTTRQQREDAARVAAAMAQAKAADDLAAARAAADAAAVRQAAQAYSTAQQAYQGSARGTYVPPIDWDAQTPTPPKRNSFDPYARMNDFQSVAPPAAAVPKRAKQKPPALQALDDLEAQFVRMAAKDCTPAIDKAWAKYEKIKEHATRTRSSLEETREQRAALIAALKLLITVIFEEENSYVI